MINYAISVDTLKELDTLIQQLPPIVSVWDLVKEPVPGKQDTYSTFLRTSCMGFEIAIFVRTNINGHWHGMLRLGEEIITKAEDRNPSVLTAKLLRALKEHAEHIAERVSNKIAQIPEEYQQHTADQILPRP